MIEKKDLETNIASLAVKSLLDEAFLHPKPGLVDRFDNGSHKDMDIGLFVKSAHSFHPYFEKYFLVGQNHFGDEKNLLYKVRQIGLEAEKSMFRSTSGINTHKGANFTYAIFISALGLYHKTNKKSDFLPLTLLDLENVFLIIKKMTRNLIEDDFKDVNSKKNLSYGELLYQKYGFLGIREEAALGYPTVFNLSLPRLIFLNKKNIYTKNQRYLEVLFLIMSSLEDSNLISRGGFEALSYVKNLSSYFLKNGGVGQEDYIKIIIGLNERFKLLNISPGGSADILAFTIFLELLLGD